MSLSFTGKILLFKNIAIKSDEVFSNFRRVPAEHHVRPRRRDVERSGSRIQEWRRGGQAETARAESRSH